jgi:hypothetical protein
MYILYRILLVADTYMLVYREERIGDEERTKMKTTSVNLCSRKRARNTPR